MMFFIRIDSSVQYKVINFVKSVYFHCVVNYKPFACTVVCVLTSQFTKLLSVFDVVRGKFEMHRMCVWELVTPINALLVLALFSYATQCL